MSFGIIPSWEIRKREVMHMGTYEVLSLLFLGGTFLIALLAYIDNRNNKQKNKPALYLDRSTGL